eukprot:18153_1
MSSKLASLLGVSGASGTTDIIIKQGWLLKRSKHLKQFHKRFIQLKGDELLSFKKEFRNPNEKPTETFDLSKYRVNIHSSKSKKHNELHFYLISDILDTFRVLKASSVQERDDWVYQIRNIIINSNTTVTQALFATVESQMASKNQQQMHDSDSEEEDDDFAEKKRTRAKSKTKRKMSYTINKDSFQNYKVRRLTLLPDADALMEDEGSDEDVVEEKEATNDDDDQVEYDQEIIQQLTAFGYRKDEIMQAIAQVVDRKNINAIREQLDTNATAISNEKAVEKESKQVKMQRKRRFIEQEIVTTEETYYNRLNTLLNELILPMFDEGYVDKKYYEQITSSLPQILEFHRDFYSELKAVYQGKDPSNPTRQRLIEFYKMHHKERANDTARIDEVLRRYQGREAELFEDLNRKYNVDSETQIETSTLAHVFNAKIMQNKEGFIEMYIEYIKHYDRLLDLFGSTFHGNDKLNAFLLQKRLERKPLPQFLILPVQRVPRYILLLQDLRKNTEQTSSDYKEIHDAVEMIKDVTQEINDRKKKIENLSQALLIQDSLHGLKQPIMNGERTFEEQFVFIKKAIMHQRLFFVFNDIVIVANEQWDVKHILQVKTLTIKVKGDEEEEEEEEMEKKQKKVGIREAAKNYKFGDITRSGRKKVTKRAMDRKGLPEFELISKGNKGKIVGRVAYVAKNIDTVNKFKMLLNQCKD